MAAATEPELFRSTAWFGRRFGPLRVLEDGNDPMQRGRLELTAERLAFTGEDGGRLVLERPQLRAVALTPGRYGRCDLWIATAAGEALLHRVPSELAEATRALGVPTRAAPPARLPSPAAGLELARRALVVGWPVLVAALAALVWTLSIEGIDIRSIGDVGLVTMLPAGALVALAVLVGGFALELFRSRPRGWVLLFHVLALIFVLYGTASVIEDVPSLNVAWRHSGITGEILSSGSVDRGVDAYFNWPGFFLLAAVATEVGGAGTAVDLARWAPVVFNLLYLPALVLLARAATADRRLQWAGVWCFYLANWVYQDYLSPQGLTYALYLGVLALLVTWFVRPERPAPAGSKPALVVAVVAAIAAAVPSHQLTPIALLLAITALTLARRSALRLLPAIALVLVAAWVAFAAGPYVDGHFDELSSGLGSIRATLSENVGARVAGADEHRIVVLFRIAMALAIWGMALAAVVRMWRRREVRPPQVVLAAAPFALILMQPYGGEVLLRVYLFALPFAALLAMSLLDLRPTRRNAAVFGAVTALILGGFLVARFGNQQALVFTPEEVAAVERVTREAPEGAAIVAPNPNLPWQAERYAELRWRTLRSMEAAPGGAAEAQGPALADRVAEFMREDGPPAAYLVVTRSVRSYDRLLGSDTWGTVAALERAVRDSPKFRVVEEEPDAVVFELTERGGRA